VLDRGLQELPGQLPVSVEEGGRGQLEPEVAPIIESAGRVLDGRADRRRQLSVGERGTVKKTFFQETAEPSRRQGRSRGGTGGGRGGEADAEGLFLKRDLPGHIRRDLRGLVPEPWIGWVDGEGGDGDPHVERRVALAGRSQEEPGQPGGIARGPHDLEQRRIGARQLRGPAPIGVKGGQGFRDALAGFLPQQGYEFGFKIPDLRLGDLLVIFAVFEGLGACQQLVQRALGGPAWKRKNRQGEGGGNGKETRSEHGTPRGFARRFERPTRKGLASQN
jgi:hypothetical protein